MANEALKQCISMPIQPGKKARSSFMHYPNGEMEELTASPLYHIVTIINNPLKRREPTTDEREKIYYIPKSTFFAKMWIIT